MKPSKIFSTNNFHTLSSKRCHTRYTHLTYILSFLLDKCSLFFVAPFFTKFENKPVSARGKSLIPQTLCYASYCNVKGKKWLNNTGSKNDRVIANNRSITKSTPCMFFYWHDMLNIWSKWKHFRMPIKLLKNQLHFPFLNSYLFLFTKSIRFNWLENGCCSIHTYTYIVY